MVTVVELAEVIEVVVGCATTWSITVSDVVV